LDIWQQEPHTSSAEEDLPEETLQKKNKESKHWTSQAKDA